MHVLAKCKYKKDRTKTTEKRWRHRFPHYKSMGAFCCHGNQSFDPICPKTLCSLSPTPVMLHIKFDQDWPTGFRDIQVWKVWTTTDDRQRRTDNRQLVYYKLTLWAFGSSELKHINGPWKPNSSELLCLSLLPASLMMIRSKMNELAWRHHFPMGNFLDLKGSYM